MPSKLPFVLVLAAACGGGGSRPGAVEPEPAAPPASPPIAIDDPLDRFAPVPPEVDRARTAVALPPVPSFALPESRDGFRTIKELRVAGNKLLGSQVKVRGHVAWIYDCIAAVGTPGERKAAVQRRIAADPDRCLRPHFHLGASADAIAPYIVRVVDVPRAPRRDDKKRLSKQELAAWPAVPKLAPGDRVIVTGTFALASPSGFTDPDGLIVFESIEAEGGK